MKLPELKERLKTMIAAEERWVESLRPMAGEDNTHDGKYYRKLVAESEHELATLKAAHDAITLAQSEGFTVGLVNSFFVSIHKPMSKPKQQPEPPSPGTKEALARGCKCPVIDNNRGRGYMGIAGVFIYNESCPVHLPKISAGRAEPRA